MLYEYVAQPSISDSIILEYAGLLKSRAGYRVITNYQSTRQDHGRSIGNMEQVCLYRCIASLAIILSSL
jgi:hypothetical protein